MNYLKHAKSYNSEHFYIIGSIIGLLLTYYYLGGFRWFTLVAYMTLAVIYLSSHIKKYKVNILDEKIIIILLLQFVVTAFTFPSLLNALLSLRLYFGFIFIYFCLKDIKLPKIRTIGALLAALTILEFISIKIEPELVLLLPNYDSTFDLGRAKLMLGGVHSFGGNRTNTSALLVAIYIFLDVNYRRCPEKYLILFASVIAMSGSALTLLMGYILIKHWRKKYVLALLFFFVVLANFPIDGNYIIEKFNIEYFLYIIGAKLEQIDFLINNFSLMQLVFGAGLSDGGNASSEVVGYGAYFGDFIFLDLLARFGLVGISLIIYFLVLTVNKASFLAILSLLLASMHYHVIFSSPGQLITSLILIEAGRRNKRQDG